MRKSLERLLHDEAGATMVEYAVVLGFIAAVAVVAVTSFGSAVSALFAKLPPGL